MIASCIPLETGLPKLFWLRTKKQSSFSWHKILNDAATLFRFSDVGCWNEKIFKMINLLGRQYWTDQRLSFNSTVIDELTMNWQVDKITYISKHLKGRFERKPHLDVIILHGVILQFLYKIWTPDTYFLNGRDSYLHKIAVPNRWDSLDFKINLWGHF